MDENASNESGGRRRRGGGRKRAQAEAAEASKGAPPTVQPRNPFQPLRAVSDDELESIHDASLDVLQEIGIDFLHDEARAILKDAGADVAADGERVRFDKQLIDSVIGKAPAEFTLHGRVPERHLVIGGDHIVYSLVASTPNVADRDGGRRVGNMKDYDDLTRLGHMLQSVHMFGGYTVEPVDVHAGIRHLVALPNMLRMSDKPVHLYSLGRERVMDSMEMVRLARGVDEATFKTEPSVITVINSSSPLRLDTPMLEGVLRMGEMGQPITLTPFTLAGAMAPVTVAGALVQQNAEALAGLAISQIANPGAPFVYGGFTSNVDMRSGAPAFGTPEYMKASLIGGQLARRYGLPYRSSNVNAANTLDAQAAYESMFSLWGIIMGGVNFIKHAAGWMEGGLQTSFEKVVLDADMLAMVSEFLKPVVVDDDSLALDAIREVGPGGHFFGCGHTQSRFKTAFFQPMISDWRNYERWEEAGSPTAYDHANRIYKELIAAYSAPPMDPAADEALEAFCRRRIEEGGAPTDF